MLLSGLCQPGFTNLLQLRLYIGCLEKAWLPRGGGHVIECHMTCMLLSTSTLYLAAIKLHRLEPRLSGRTHVHT